MTDPNGVKDPKDGGTEGEPAGGAKGKQPEGKASSPKTYNQDAVDKLLKDKENELKGQQGWDNKKLQEEIKELKAKNEATEKATKEAKLQAVADKFGVDLEKAKEVSENPEQLEKMFELAGKKPAEISFRPDKGGGSGGSGELTIEQVQKMSPQERAARRSEIAKMPLTLGSKR